MTVEFTVTELDSISYELELNGKNQLAEMVKKLTRNVRKAGLETASINVGKALQSNLMEHSHAAKIAIERARLKDSGEMFPGNILKSDRIEDGDEELAVSFALAFINQHRTA